MTVSSESDDVLLSADSVEMSVRSELSVAKDEADNELTSDAVLAEVVADDMEEAEESEDELPLDVRIGRGAEGASRLEDLLRDLI